MNKHRLTALFSMLLMLAVGLTGIPWPFTSVVDGRMPRTVQAAEGMRNVQLGTDGLVRPQNVDGDWNGSFVYFGNLSGYPMLFRVLDPASREFGEGSAILLDGAYALKRHTYDEAGTGSWTGSALRTYLNNEFFRGSFSTVERKAIRHSTKTAPSATDGNGGGSIYAPLADDRIFLLDAAEATNASYGYSGGDALAKENMKLESHLSPWLLRNTQGNRVVAVNETGALGTVGQSELLYISPALCLDPDRLLFTYPSEQNKPSRFSRTDTTSADDFWKLTLMGGEGFQAVRPGNDAAVPAGFSFLVHVTDMGKEQSGVNYTQISGMLVDANGEVLAYGPLSQTAATGEVLVTIPDQTPAGRYELCVFGEDVRSAATPHATDYASNFARIPVTVTESAPISEETRSAVEIIRAENEDPIRQEQQQVAPAQEQPKQEASSQEQPKQEQPKQEQPKEEQPKQEEPKQEQPKQEQPKQEQQQITPAQQVQPKQTGPATYRITVTTDGHGDASASMQTATPGTRVTLSQVPRDNYHIRTFESSDVAIAADNSFVMPEHDVSIRAFFDPNPVMHRIIMTTDGHGTAYASAGMAYANNWITISATPQDGYRLLRWESAEVNPGGQNQFLMPDRDVTLRAVFEQIPVTTYRVRADRKGEGNVWITASNGQERYTFQKGEKVVVHWNTNKSHRFKTLRADDIDFSGDEDDGELYFYMPAREVNLTAVFVEKEEKQYRVKVVIKGSGFGWTTDSNGNSRDTFKEGESVLVQYGSNNAEFKSIKSDQVRFDDWGDCFRFFMPKENVTITLKYVDPEPEYYNVALEIAGFGGSARVVDEKGKSRVWFEEGERVVMKFDYTPDETDLMIYADSLNIHWDGNHTCYFYMPPEDTYIVADFEPMEDNWGFNPADTPGVVYDDNIIYMSDGDIFRILEDD